MTTTSHRIYVACLASYNAGTMHGRWIDLDGMDEDDVRQEIAEMLRESPNPNVEVDCPECDGDGHDCPGTCLEGEPCAHLCETCGGTGKVPSAEEWAVHDYDGIPSSFGEYPDLTAILAYIEAHEEHGEAWDAYLDWQGADHASKEDFEERYRGTYRTIEAYAEQFADDIGMLSGMPDNLRCYFDWERFAHDLEIGGDIYSCPGGDGVFIFDCH